MRHWELGGWLLFIVFAILVIAFVGCVCVPFFVYCARGYLRSFHLRHDVCSAVRCNGTLFVGYGNKQSCRTFCLKGVIPNDR